MKKLLLSLMLLSAARAQGQTDYSPERLRQICNELAPNIEDAGFVCIERNSPRYLRCHDPELVWVMMDCSPPLRCISPLMSWNTSDPCGWPIPPFCGDGFMDDGEQCELGGTGCGTDCLCLPGYAPATPASLNCIPTNLCGDGNIDGEEQCEIGGVGCAADCTCQAGYMPTNPVSLDCAPIPTCGNGALNDGEQCELGGVGCNAECKCQDGYVPTVPVSENCALVPLCGNGVINADEQCEVGGVGCNTNCMCEEGYKPKEQPEMDCVPNCGDGVIDAGEQCEVGGVGCSTNCMCEEGFIPADPVAKDCVRQQVPTCGNGVIDAGEECEVGGVECGPDCTCKDGFIPTDPVSTDCVEEPSRPYMTERDLCLWFTDSAEDAGFVCLNENSTEYLRCHLLEEVAVMMPCPAGTRCRAPVDVFTTFNPCIWEAPFPVEDYLWIYDGERRTPEGCTYRATCGNGVIDPDEQCERGGVGCTFNCNSSCQCAPYFRPTDPVSADCELDADSLCAALALQYGRQVNYICPSALFAGNSSQVIRCDGGKATMEVCPEQMFCASNDAFAENPCSAAEVNRCGNGEINVGEQCDGGFGCTDNCVCQAGFKPTTPESIDCVPVADNTGDDRTRICHDLNATGFVCSEDQNNNSFVWCESGAFVAEVNCPLGTVCARRGLSVENPCLIPNTCGNGVVEPEEQCEAGGLGCNAQTCTCVVGYAPTTPASTNCRFTNATTICAAQNLLASGENHFGCISGIEDYFVLCPGDTTEPIIEQCPRGTKCMADVFTTDTPCKTEV